MNYYDYAIPALYFDEPKNFKIVKGQLILNEGVNILVGDNEAGKSTIIEAIHLAFTGLHVGIN